MKHSDNRRPGSGWPQSIDARQDRHIVRAAVAAGTASREEIRAHVAPAESPRSIGNRLLAAGLTYRVHVSRLPPAPRHRQARLLWLGERVEWRVGWHYVVFIDECRFCLYSSDGRTSVRRRPGDLYPPEYIRPRHTGTTSDSMEWRPSVTSRGQIWRFCKVK